MDIENQNPDIHVRRATIATYKAEEEFFRLRMESDRIVISGARAAIKENQDALNALLGIQGNFKLLCKGNHLQSLNLKWP
jgi:ethanolamine utilization protein EutA (predicted chaperonin)